MEASLASSELGTVGTRVWVSLQRGSERTPGRGEGAAKRYLCIPETGATGRVLRGQPFVLFQLWLRCHCLPVEAICLGPLTELIKWQGSSEDLSHLCNPVAKSFVEAI